MRRPKSRHFRQHKRQAELGEIELLESWIESGKPESGSNPLSFSPLPSSAPVGRLDDGTFSPFAGCRKFDQMPLSQKTKDGLREAKYTKMTEIQRASLPHALCDRDVLGAAKTGSGKTLAFIVPCWPLNCGRKDVDTEKEHVNDLNILICTPGRLLQHMDETPNFDCSQLQDSILGCWEVFMPSYIRVQVLVLDEADRILDVGFKKTLNAIISQIPKRRQTLLFSATQTKSVQDLARLSLKDPEYLGVHEESVKFVFEAFKKLRPGIPLKCLHGRMKQERRMGIYSQFCEQRSVLFSTDVASRGLDFNKAVDWLFRWIVQRMLHLIYIELDVLHAILVWEANTKRLQPVSGLLAALLVKDKELQHLAIEPSSPI
ncbi:unnamed protein product [Thlaspi arvense]|uniref:ATP-dependent RNA helicase n=1 Tax=Thlaspi arvense TaxID=13288 RepID=A0AAU9RIQ6_THLAR|nr:unnamed protein product [Thlaspi arvense]